MVRAIRIKALLGICLVLTSCSLVAVPQPVVPSVEEVPASTNAITVFTLDELRSQAQTEGNPTDAVELKVDPEIVALVGEVSRQNLMGYVYQLESYGNRNIFSAQDRPDWGIGAAANWLASEFERVGNGRLQVSFQTFPFTFEGLSTNLRNVVAVLPGVAENPGIVVLMSNHDNRAEDWLDGEDFTPGADDNASGVAQMLEVARLMSSREWNNTLIFVSPTAEEQGTFGSRHFVQNAIAEEMPIMAAINNDMVGGRAGIPQSVRLFSQGPDTATTRQLGRYVHLLGSLYLPDFPITMIDGLDREGRWGDHREFVRLGIPAIRLIESQEDLEIQDSEFDTWDRIDYNYLQKVTELNLVTIANLAAAPHIPQSPAVAPTDPPGSYTVVWDISQDAAGYAIAFRPLNSMTYEGTIFHYVSMAEAGNVLMSGMNPTSPYAVSLAALDRQGRISLFSREVVLTP